MQISTETFIGARPFVADDMIWIIEHGVKEFGLKCYATDNMRKLAERREENGKCVTGIVNDEIIGCAGIDLMWQGVGEVWLLLSYEINKYPVRAYKVIRDGFAELIDDDSLWRIQAWGRIGFTQAHTLFKHLGFKPEGIAKKYTPDGVDCILYSIVR